MVFESRESSLIQTEKQNIFSLILLKQLTGLGTLPLSLVPMRLFKEL